MSKKQEIENEFDLEMEDVIGMTTRNRQAKDKKELQRQQMLLKKKKRKKRIIRIIILIVIIIAAIVFAMVSPIFNIKEIAVEGNNIVSEDTIVSLSELELDQNLFRFNKSNVINEIKTNPYIQNVKISRIIPNKVLITVEERNRDFNVEFLNEYAYINNQGYILEISEKAQKIPTIKGISTDPSEIVEGNRLNVQDLEKLEVVIQIMDICKNYEINKKVTSINIEDKSNYIIYMKKEKKEIYLGDSSNLNNKIMYIPALLKANKKKEGIIYLNGDLNNGFRPRFREKV